jgi:hypothetical protein
LMRRGSLPGVRQFYQAQAARGQPQARYRGAVRLLH